MVEVKNLTKFYGSIKAVDDISFTVETGEVLGFLGPNGAGKSTTMNMITGYLSSTSGLYSPIAPRITPATTKPVSILAGVSFVLSMRI